ncbi:unnamed protein product [Paramecium primaurelia]|uniref:Uncharacterized protein n=1 Tax=Paramecium primaurelia TaxID=5886 RepID=A0A8S1ML99_PARPR|nr:unnamed protein product [Paramecium primaurelia]
MNYQQDDQQLIFEQQRQFENPQFYDGIIWDYKENPPRKIRTNYQISITKTLEILYLRDGCIMRRDQVKDTSNKLEILANLEQINHLKWIGDYGQNNQKISKWIATWKGEVVQNVGGQYNECGRKEGQWKEIIQNYWGKAQVYEVGRYENGLRQGTWKYIYDDQEIGGGEYNLQGLKNGKWMELWEEFWHFSQVTYFGEYINGIKVGKWEIWYKKQYGDYQSEKIGGGFYDEEGNGYKKGKWVELYNGFYDSSPITYHGEYKNSKKVGRWNIYFNYGENKEMQNLIKFNLFSGGGSYDERGDEIKIGHWIELSNGFFDQSQITYNGEYKNGQKAGRWNIYFNQYGNNKIIGGGQYDEDGNGIKIGDWIELSDGFYEYSQITYNGKYQNGKKVGQWNIYHTQFENKKILGGGSYDEKGNGTKIGKWIELTDGFNDYQQVTYIGEYQNGIKVGKWDIVYQEQKIGGGQYTEEGQKIGLWIEQSEGFKYDSQITYNGEYKNGSKQGRWDILKEDKQMQSIQYSNIIQRWWII